MKPIIGLILFLLLNLSIYSQNVIETWPNGYPKTTGQYVDGKKDGLWTEFYESGGIQNQGSYSMDKKVGVWKGFFAAGAVKNIVDHTKGTVKIFNEKGDLYSEGSIKDDKKEGKWIVYYDNG